MTVWLLARRGVFIIAVHHAFVLGLGARHGGIVKLSVGVVVWLDVCDPTRVELVLGFLPVGSKVQMLL